ncbi:MAG TPA: TMEM175 family protein [Actinomycetota bacterium]|nr:TMEM175 family protein [Actinomycetota bacterium]
METNRLEAFSDGVFAIAITLLIIEVAVPEGHGPLLDRLIDQWPSYLAYTLSFATIGVMWANHHNIYPLISRPTHGLVVANLALLLVVAFIPFPTKVLGENLRGVAFADKRTAALFYNGTFFLMAVAYNTMWQVAAWNNRLIKRGCEGAAAAVSRVYWPGSPAYVVAIVIAFWSPVGSIIANTVVMFLYGLPIRGLLHLQTDRA